MVDQTLGSSTSLGQGFIWLTHVIRKRRVTQTSGSSTSLRQGFYMVDQTLGSSTSLRQGFIWLTHVIRNVASDQTLGSSTSLRYALINSSRSSDSLVMLIKSWELQISIWTRVIVVVIVPMRWTYRIQCKLVNSNRANSAMTSSPLSCTQWWRQRLHPEASWRWGMSLV